MTRLSGQRPDDTKNVITIMIHDNRPTKMKQEMAACFEMNEAEYRESDWANIVYENDDIVVVEDTRGYEFSEWQEEFDEFSEIMHDLADQLVDRRWPATYPIVFNKYE